MRTIMKRIAMLGIVFLLATSAALAQQRGGRGQREGLGKPKGRQAGVAAAGATAEPAIKPTHADVVYVARGSQELKLDAYLAESDKPTPVMVYIHGGGWRGGGKALGTRFPMFLLEQGRKAGISIFSIQYRLTGVEPHPAQRLDCERAIQFIRYKAKEWNIDPPVPSYRFARRSGRSEVERPSSTTIDARFVYCQLLGMRGPQFVRTNAGRPPVVQNVSRCRTRNAAR